MFGLCVTKLSGSGTFELGEVEGVKSGLQYDIGGYARDVAWCC